MPNTEQKTALTSVDVIVMNNVMSCYFKSSEQNLQEKWNNELI